KDLLNESLEEAQRLKFWESYVMLSASLFDLYMAESDSEKAFEVINKALSKTQVLDVIWLRLMLYEKLEKYYSSIYDYKNAYKYAGKKFQLNEEYLGKSKNETIQELTIKYQTHVKNEKIKQLNDNVRKDRRLRLYFIGGIILLSSILTLIIFLLNRISVQKKKLQETNQTKDQLFSIIAHDLRSPLIALQGIGPLIQKYIIHNERNNLVRLGEKIDETT